MCSPALTDSSNQRTCPPRGGFTCTHRSSSVHRVAHLRVILVRGALRFWPLSPNTTYVFHSSYIQIPKSFPPSKAKINSNSGLSVMYFIYYIYVSGAVFFLFLRRLGQRAAKELFLSLLFSQHFISLISRFHVVSRPANQFAFPYALHPVSVGSLLLPLSFTSSPPSLHSVFSR